MKLPQQVHFSAECPGEKCPVVRNISKYTISSTNYDFHKAISGPLNNAILPCEGPINGL